MQTFLILMREVDRAIADGEEEGFVKIHVKKGTDQILGATIVARHAREMLNEITLAMVGNKAIARSDLDPDGYVFIEGERWKATAEDGPVRRGEAVTITSVKGFTLTVRHRDANPHA